MPLIQEDLDLKHREMKASAFTLLRGMFYRWVQHWEALASDPKFDPKLPMQRAPRILSIGDLHVENFGTWRDGDSRLCWGINDFDEAHLFPYTQDLVRLATSARLARDDKKLDSEGQDMCAAILQGYSDGLEPGSQPFVLEDRNHWLRELAQSAAKPPKTFWEEMRGNAHKNALPLTTENSAVRAMLVQELPLITPQFFTRQAGVGSLGHPRILALVDWNGGPMVREAKALAPSAAVWADPKQYDPQIRYEQILKQAVRSPDPTFKPVKSWIVRRLMPSAVKIPLKKLPDEATELRLLRAMGRETAHIHKGTAGAADRIKVDLALHDPEWLRLWSKEMAQRIRDDFAAFKK